jgi:hypothetical protein
MQKRQLFLSETAVNGQPNVYVNKAFHLHHDRDDEHDVVLGL